MEERNDIVIYKSEDGLVKMEAMVDPENETIWASQKAIAALFDCTKQNVNQYGQTSALTTEHTYCKKYCKGLKGKGNCCRN